MQMKKEKKFLMMVQAKLNAINNVANKTMGVILIKDALRLKDGCIPNEINKIFNRACEFVDWWYINRSGKEIITPKWIKFEEE